MEWLPYVHDAIEYIEANLLTIQNAREVADELSMSEVHLQKGFHIITGFSLAEYIRDRRLYEAAVEIVSTDTGIVGYSTEVWIRGSGCIYQGIYPVSWPGSGCAEKKRGRV